MGKKIQPLSTYVVAIGASAGGLEAIHNFFDRIPSDIDVAYVLIQHLSSDYKSLLVELVSKHTHMKVIEASEGQLVEPACVYVIPNNKLITIQDGRLHLEKKVEKVPNNAIDNFFLSLAKDKKEKAIAIVLSGTGNDGTKGIEAIKDQGGLVIAQQPDTAKFDSMPVNAIASGVVDFVVPTSEMYDKITGHINSAPIRKVESGGIDEQYLDKIFDLIYGQTGHDFSLYKTPTIFRRIGRRMKELNIELTNEYVDYLIENRQEVSLLSKDFLIGVTQFFRDEAAFNIVKNKVIPEIIARKDDGDVLKVWICACSTGEEVYSIAILIDQYLKTIDKHIEVKIFASDIDDASLEIASKNNYPESFVKFIPENILEDYFVHDGKRISVVPHIRKQVVFAKHDVIKSPPFIKNDLICCRNMLIYMNNILQQKILTTFHYSLNTGGYLFLGPSETIAPIKDGVTEISAKWKVYRKSGVIPRPNEFADGIRTDNTGRFSMQVRQRVKVPAEEQFQRFLVNQYGYVGVFIDRNFEVRDTVGDYRRFLSLPDKKLEVNLLKMVPKELSFMLSNTIRSVWKENKMQSLKRARVRRGNDEVYVNIDVTPANEEVGQSYTLVAFKEVETEVLAPHYVVPIDASEQQTGYVMELENELNETRSNLQIAMEEMETTNEELQSSNEELLSANEELQSGNEELQSLNEELHTLNAEHQQKINELIELNDDLNNYFKSVDIGQIFLGKNGQIRKFNPAAVEMVNLIEADIGRPISHISNNIKYDHFLQDINEALAHSDYVTEKEIELSNHRMCLMRILPYTRVDGKKDGVVITFIDITTLNEQNNIIAGVFRASLSAILIFKPIRTDAKKIVDFECLAANKMAMTISNRSGDSLFGLKLKNQLADLTDAHLMDRFKGIYANEDHLETEVQLNNQNWYIVTASKMSDMLAVTYTDVTERKKNEQSLKRNFNDLVHTRESLKELNNQLENRVRERTSSLAESENRFNLVSMATNDTIWDWDLVNNTIWRNHNFDKMFGFDRNAHSESTSFWYEHIHPEDRQRVRESVHKAINEQEENWSAEYRFAKADESYVEVLDRGSIQVDSNGVPYRMVGSVIDVTRVKEAESDKQELKDYVLRQQKEFYELFAHVPALISIRRGEKLTYEYTNTAFDQFYGGLSFKSLATDDAHAEGVDKQLYQADTKILKEGIAVSGKALAITKYNPDGKEIGNAWMDYLFTPVFNEKEEIDGVAFFGFEVSELVKAQLATKDLMHRKDEFMSIASHELKTPLTSLKGMLQIASRYITMEKPKATIEEFVGRSLKQTDKLTFLINDLLDVTKIHAGKLQLNYSEFNIAEVLGDLVSGLQAEDQSLHIEVDSPENITVTADQFRIEQVLSNFLSNAIKYSPDSKEVTVKLVLQEEHRVYISVMDSGIGIPKDKQSYVFDRFFRAEESNNYSGLGLGLYICKDIIERHGGTIGLDSEEGQGSTFWFTLPVA
ncbi:ATP-binding protein [Sphingobacterium sp. lm-10]|uniref:chemotaxis protein CheB n=1 Tax=Sphingobacterium sp. lm-10 TaxID=2944904 RepID=UPI002021A72F|nr:chemotaxis protein CheB [Sphingobacterium sp. lm-10]MCL7986578.1 ATP-binding protein [Sphingobacterium sp. lm-10]